MIKWKQDSSDNPWTIYLQWICETQKRKDVQNKNQKKEEMNPKLIVAKPKTIETKFKNHLFHPKPNKLDQSPTALLPKPKEWRPSLNGYFNCLCQMLLTKWPKKEVDMWHWERNQLQHHAYNTDDLNKKKWHEIN